MCPCWLPSLWKASSPCFLNKTFKKNLKAFGLLSHSRDIHSSRHSRNTLPLISLGVIPRPTASNTMDPSDVISAAHSVINENWKQIPTRAKSSQSSTFLSMLQCLENKKSSFVKSQVSVQGSDQFSGVSHQLSGSWVTQTARMHNLA